jgi:hypothetical protein
MREILTVLKEIEHKITAKVDSGRVADIVAGISK